MVHGFLRYVQQQSNYTNHVSRLIAFLTLILWYLGVGNAAQVTRGKVDHLLKLVDSTPVKCSSSVNLFIKWNPTGFLNDSKDKRESYSLEVTAGKLALNAFKDKIDNIHNWLQFRVSNSNMLSTIYIYYWLTL